MNSSAHVEQPPTALCEVAAALVYIALESRSPNTGISRLNEDEVLYNVLNYQWIGATDVTKDFFSLLNNVNEIKLCQDITCKVYDDHYPVVKENTLQMASANYDEKTLNEVLNLIKMKKLKIKYKRKSRNLRVSFALED